jgi:hypothetical protein
MSIARCSGSSVENTTWRAGTGTQAGKARGAGRCDDSARARAHKTAATKTRPWHTSPAAVRPLALTFGCGEGAAALQQPRAAGVGVDEGDGHER